MPKPEAGETEKDYMPRCMGDADMLEKYPDEGQRFAVCKAIFDKGDAAMGNRSIPLVPIVNRAQADGKFALPADGWYLIAPIGDHPHSPHPFFPESMTQKSLIQVVDAPAIQSMVNRFKTEFPDGNPGLLVDWEHDSETVDKSTAAAGWIEDLSGRKDGLWAKIRLTNRGLEMVQGGQYRFISPTWNPEECEVISGNRIRPLRLKSAGLTNNYNLRGLPPLSNRTGLDGSADSDSNKKHSILMQDKMKTVLGLSASATDEEAIQAAEKINGTVTALTNKLTTAETAAKTAADALTAEQDKVRVAEAKMNEAITNATKLEADLKTLRNDVAKADFAPFADKVPKEAHELVIGNLLHNRVATLAMLQSYQAPTPAHGAVLNRTDGKAPTLDLSQVADTKFQALVNKIKTEKKLTSSKAVEYLYSIANTDADAKAAIEEYRTTGGPLAL
jgi:hypothetical protein